MTKNNKSAKSAKSAKKEFEISTELEELANKIISEQSLDVSPSKISYLLVYPNIAKTVAGRCIKTSKELAFFSGNDYLIEMSGELWDALDDSVRYVLMQHELMHIMVAMNDKTGDWKFELRRHDIEDFSAIIKKHGVDWISKVKLSISSLYDLNPSQEDKIQI